MGLPSRSFPLLLGAALLGGSLLGCGGRQAEWSFDRLIEEPPILELRAADLTGAECARELDVGGGTLPTELELTEGQVHPGGEGGLSLVGGAKAPSLRWRKPLDDDEARGLSIEVSGLRRGRLELLRTPVGSAGEPRTTTLDPESSTSGRHRYVADWSEDPIGGPFRLELRPTTAAGEIVTLERLCLVRSFRRRDDLAAVEERAWKITVDGETRDALLFGEEGGRGSLRVGPRSRLDFGLALFSGADGDLSVEVRARGPGGEHRLVEGSPWRVESGAPRWRDFAVDLAALAPGDYEFEVTIGGGDGRLFAWSAPQVRGSGSGSRPPNILLVVIDTLRADHLSLHGYPRATSPHLDRWAAKHATVFDRVVAPAGWTLPSHFSLFTGLDAFRHSANYYRGSFDSSSYRFLAAELWRKGYRTQALTGGSFVGPDFGLAVGFESFRAWQGGFGLEEELVENLRRANEILDAPDAGPLFLFFHTYLVHTPNPAREPYFGSFSALPAGYTVQLVTDAPDPATGFEGSLHAVLDRDGERTDPVPPELAGLVVDTYDSAIAAADERLAPLLDRAVSGGSLGPTVVAVTSDHGESLTPERAGHGYLTPDNLSVPLLLSVPGRRGGKRVGGQVRLLDLYATLLELTGSDLPEGVDSRSLVPYLDSPAAPGRTAYSYAASMNYGLARTEADGAMVTWSNSPWLPIAGKTGTARFAGPAAPPGKLATDSAVRDLQRRYEASAPGIRLEASTRAGRDFDVEIASELIDPVATKSPSPPVPGLTWRSIGRLAARIDAEHPLRLAFERLPRDSAGFAFVVRGPEGCGEPTRASFGDKLETLRSGRRYQMPLPACPGSGSQELLEIRIELAGAVPTESLTAGNKELEQELRALGYLE